jgi:hypothetical protein
MVACVVSATPCGSAIGRLLAALAKEGGGRFRRPPPDGQAK